MAPGLCARGLGGRETQSRGAHAALHAIRVRHRAPGGAAEPRHGIRVAAKTGDAVGGLLNATLGNLTELVIALTALLAGEYMLVKASIAGAIVTNTLFVLGASFSSADSSATSRNTTGRRPPAGRPARPGHGRAGNSFGRLQSRRRRGCGVQSEVECGFVGAAHLRVWIGHALFAQNAPGAVCR